MTVSVVAAAGADDGAPVPAAVDPEDPPQAASSPVSPTAAIVARVIRACMDGAFRVEWTCAGPSDRRSTDYAARSWHADGPPMSVSSRRPGTMPWHAWNVRVLVVEDEPLLASFIEQGLTSLGYRVEIAVDGPAGLEAVSRSRPDVVLLDAVLPELDGFEVLRRLRQTEKRLPVIMVTALDAVDDRVRGLGLGANDYLSKPFAFAELAARVAAQIRAEGARDARSDRLQAGRVAIDLLTRDVEVDGARVVLSTQSFDLLVYLARHAGQVLTRQQLLDGVWNIDFDPRSNVVDVAVRALRKQLGRHDDLIETVRGAGYRLR